MNLWMISGLDPLYPFTGHPYSAVQDGAAHAAEGTIQPGRPIMLINAASTGTAAAASFDLFIYVMILLCKVHR